MWFISSSHQDSSSCFLLRLYLAEWHFSLAPSVFLFQRESDWTCSSLALVVCLPSARSPRLPCSPRSPKTPCSPPLLSVIGGPCAPLPDQSVLAALAPPAIRVGLMPCVLRLCASPRAYYPRAYSPCAYSHQRTLLAMHSLSRAASLVLSRLIPSRPVSSHPTHPVSTDSVLAHSPHNQICPSFSLSFLPNITCSTNSSVHTFSLHFLLPLY
jgi:hypothetical protein